MYKRKIMYHPILDKTGDNIFDTLRELYSNFDTLRELYSNFGTSIVYRDTGTLITN